MKNIMNNKIIKQVSLIIIMGAAALQMQAQDFLTIKFNNGQAEERIYEMDIDSMVCSKIGIDSLVYEDWVVQEIWTADSVYRYSLAEISSIDVTTVDIEELAKHTAKAVSTVEPIFLECSSTSELTPYLETIRSTEGVEDVWTDDITLFVKIKDGGTITFMYPPAISENIETRFETEISHIMSRVAQAKNNEGEYLKVKSVCLVNQMHRAQDRQYVQQLLDGFKEHLGEMGIERVETPAPDVSFFANGMFGYDLVMLATHGGYANGTHWLYTDEELFISDNALTVSDLEDKWRNFYQAKYASRYSDNMVYIGGIKEIRGKECVVYYRKVSEHLIGGSGSRFQNKSIVFNAACKSMVGMESTNNTDEETVGNVSNSLASKFLKKGAGCYLGFTDSNTIGVQSGICFFENMLNGHSALGALKDMSMDLREESFTDKNGILHTPRLTLASLHDEDAKYSCIVQPVLEELAETTESDLFGIRLQGRIKLLYPQDSQKVEYGFTISEDENMKSKERLGAFNIDDGKTILDYKNDYSLVFSFTLDKTNETFEIKPGKTYYCSTYLYDKESDSYCYGTDVQSITWNLILCPDDNHPHAIDLGLPSGTKWACCNVASKPEDQRPEGFGGYFAWGETVEKSYYSADNYNYELAYSLPLDIAGTQNDVAHVMWGDMWVMPNKTQFYELTDNCSCESATINDVDGTLFVGKNGKAIFLPPAGLSWKDEIMDVHEVGYYWLSIQYPYSENSWDTQWGKFIIWDIGGLWMWVDDYWAAAGHSIRPVYVQK